MKYLALSAVLVIGFASIAFSQEYKGAGAALKAVADRASKGTANASRLQDAIKEYKAAQGTMSADQAAAGWLKLFNMALGKDSSRVFNQVGVAQVVEVIPPPASWKAISTSIKTSLPAPAKRSSLDWSKSLFVAILNSDFSNAFIALDALSAKPEPDSDYGYGYGAANLSADLAAKLGDKARLERILKARIAKGTAGGGVPDLVALFGKQAAADYLLKILTSAKADVGTVTGPETLKLARKIALDNVAKLKAPQWSLTMSTDTIELFQAMSKRWPKAGAGQGEGYRTQALGYYVMGLIVRGDIDRATTILTQGSEASAYAYMTISNELQKRGDAQKVYAFLRSLLKKKPTIKLWSVYALAATQTGHSKDLIADLRKELSSPTLKGENREAVQDGLVAALLAADQVDEGIAILRSTLAAHPENGASLTRVGILLNKPAWIEEGISAAKKPREGAYPGYGTGSAEELVPLLVELNRGPEAEEILVDSMAASQSIPGMNMMGADRQLIQLAGLYERVGRYADTVILMDTAPSWTKADLSGIYTQPDAFGRPMGYVAASALAHTGKKDDAARILEAVLYQSPSFDPAYELYLDIKGDSAMALFESLYKRDRFEERPLIWKAEALRRSGKLDEAEKIARQAIQVDPSDGDQVLGTRLKAYSVLAEIRKAQGADEESEQLGEAIKAIRKSEQADKFLVAGLQSRAIKMYAESLEMFADAYCIQSRLAVNLASQGRYDEAAVHYRKAYELMPDSFGRVETHCFGCEGVFEGEVAQSVAEKVFAELLQKTPQKPQVHYLMGYLREDEGRKSEAAVHYREAVRLDPDYLNAWAHLEGLADDVLMTPKERDTIAFQLLRLDPQMRHGQQAVDTLDLKKLWETVEQGLGAVPILAPDKLYDFPVSRAVIEARRTNRNDESPFGDMEYGRAYSQSRTSSPGEAVARSPYLMQVISMLDQFARPTAFER